MKTHRYLTTMVATAFLSVAALAQVQHTPKGVPWAKEPDSFMGIRFGLPLMASVIECPVTTENGVTIQRYWELKRPCWERVADFASVHNLAGFTTVYVHEVDHRVASISASFKPEAFEDVSIALTARFGAPTSTATSEVQNSAGATFKNHQLFWKGLNAELTCESVGLKTDESRLEIDTRAYIDLLESQRQERIEALKKLF